MSGPENYLIELDAIGQASLVRSGELSGSELLEWTIERAERIGVALNCLTITDYEGARERAAGKFAGPFGAVPWLAKDITLQTKGVPTTAGLQSLAKYLPAHDSLIVQRLYAAGFNLFAKSATPQLASGTTTEGLMFGPCRNPWDLNLSAGGSSGGAGAAVAARIVPIAHASDGGGSIRVPAALNGLVGFKPSAGATDYSPDRPDYWHGIVQEGCLSWSVRDTVAYASVLYRRKADHIFRYGAPGHFHGHTDRSKQLRIGMITTHPSVEVQPSMSAAVLQASAILEDLGHRIEDAVLPDAVVELLDPLGIIVAAQSAAEIQRISKLLGRSIPANELEPVIRLAVDHGAMITGPQYSLALDQLFDLARRLIRWMGQFDMIITPTVPCETWPLGFISTAHPDMFNQRVLQTAAFTLPFSVTGNPAISLPLVTLPNGLPLGIQIVGRLGADNRLLALAAELERCAPWHHRKPPIATSD